VSVAPEHVAARAGDVRDSQADITKARTLLGYEPTVPFDEGLRRTLEWYKTTAARA
jgi:nucleoside-diphosphate-sugar epimerase